MITLNPLCYILLVMQKCLPCIGRYVFLYSNILSGGMSTVMPPWLMFNLCATSSIKDSLVAFLSKNLSCGNLFHAAAMTPY